MSYSKYFVNEVNGMLKIPCPTFYIISYLSKK